VSPPKINIGIEGKLKKIHRGRQKSLLGDKKMLQPEKHTYALHTSYADEKKKRVSRGNGRETVREKGSFEGVVELLMVSNGKLQG